MPPIQVFLQLLLLLLCTPFVALCAAVLWALDGRRHSYGEYWVEIALYLVESPWWLLLVAAGQWALLWGGMLHHSLWPFPPLRP